MVEHIVLIKFSTEPDQEQKEKLLTKTYALKNEIPGIIDLQQGFNFSDRSKGFQVGLTVRFEDREALAQYRPHPKHQELISYLQEIGLEDMIVVDFDID